MQPYVATKQWKDGFGAGETRITASDLTRIEAGDCCALHWGGHVRDLSGRAAGVLDAHFHSKEVERHILSLRSRVVPVDIENS